MIYNTSGTYLTAAVVIDEPIKFEVNGQHIAARGFAADTKIYFYELGNNHEAHFLVAVLNSPVINKLIKPMQSRGLWGPRDIHKKPLEFPIPRFDNNNPDHQRLAELGEKCGTEVEQWLASVGPGKIKSIGKLRSMVREMLKDELEQIDVLVKKILGNISL